jgi:hypothetical protein
MSPNDPTPDPPPVIDETLAHMQAWRAAQEAAVRGIPTSFPMAPPPPPAVGLPPLNAEATMQALKARRAALEASKQFDARNWPPK